MKIRYLDLEGPFAITADDSGVGFIRVHFVNGDLYEYICELTGRQHVESMKQLATVGRDRCTCVSRFMHDTCARKA